MSTPDFHVERVEAPVLYELRLRVLRGDDPKKSAQDLRDADPTSVHFGGFIGDRLVVSASFFPGVAPMSDELASYQLRYMATDFDVQGQGYGAIVLAAALDELRALGAALVWAYARDTALGFYRATGWTVVEGSEHVSAETQLPHTAIIRMLGDDTEMTNR